MIVFDTNVVSELMRPVPEPAVLRWLADRDPALFYTTSITEAEILTGLALMPQGRRRSDLEKAALGMFAENFTDRVLPFDRAAAPFHAVIVAHRRRLGWPLPDSAFDAMIAAVARAHGAAVATRNTADFEGCGVALHDPWQEG